MAIPQNPLVAIIGATGTGKSELAVKLAAQFNGEIINADALQLYQGLDIITNKISLEEQKNIPHHLLANIGLGEPTWTVGQYATQALGVIDGIRQRKKLPIVVGGTHYYMQSLLFSQSLASEEQVGDGKYLTPEEMSKRWPILDAPTEDILAELAKVDPVMANRWHPRDRRKIQRSLEIWLRTGRRASDIYEKQLSARKAGAADAVESSIEAFKGLRCPTLILWVHTDREVLYDRLDSRVDQMQLSGLFEEIRTMSNFASSQPSTLDQTSGIWIAIGYKEFQPYLRILDEEADEDVLEVYKGEGLEKMKTRTRQYARRQVQWIRIKLIHALRNHSASGSLFLLDGTHHHDRAQNVDRVAFDLVTQFLQGGELPDPKSLSPAAAELLAPRREYDMSARPDLWERRICNACNVTIVTESDWNSHVKSKGHKAAEKRSKESV